VGIDNDLSALLPEPPLPRPARREAAVEEALRRFDAGGEHAPELTSRPRRAPARGGWARPQIAALASIALVVLVSVPIWLTERNRLPGGPIGVSSPAQGEATPSVVPTASPQPATPAATAPGPAEPENIFPPLTATREQDRGIVLSQTAPPQPLQDAQLAQDEVRLSEKSSGTIAASGFSSGNEQRQERQVAAARQAAPSLAERTSNQGIVVTGSRVARADMAEAPAAAARVPAERGDWNACTVLDPRRSASACRTLGRTAAPDAAGHLSDGLTLAWQGDLDSAIDAFDRAIRTAPNLSIAYLNRGLTYQLKGNPDRALADLDRAIARDPSAAQAYYYRSRLRRAAGDSAGADADVERAAKLDSQ